LAARHITKSANATWKISNRTRANAESLAESLGGVAVAFPPTPDDIKWADIVVSATNSPGMIITGEDIAAVLTARKTPLLFLDLAVPRDVDSDLKRDSNTYIYSVDDFTEMVRANLKTREREAVRAEKLVERLVTEFSTWYKENRISPTIQQLREVLEEIRSSEVENNLRRFCVQDRAQVEKFSKSLINKVTSLIIANMKHASLNQNDLSLARAISMAFATSDDSAVKDVLEQLKHELSH
jgi:glutamyl-tRNA reductase